MASSCLELDRLWVSSYVLPAFIGLQHTIPRSFQLVSFHLCCPPPSSSGQGLFIIQSCVLVASKQCWAAWFVMWTWSVGKCPACYPTCSGRPELCVLFTLLVMVLVKGLQVAGDTTFLRLFGTQQYNDRTFPRLRNSDSERILFILRLFLMYELSWNSDKVCSEAYFLCLALLLLSKAFLASSSLTLQTSRFSKSCPLWPQQYLVCNTLSNTMCLRQCVSTTAGSVCCSKKLLRAVVPSRLFFILLPSFQHSFNHPHTDIKIIIFSTLPTLIPPGSGFNTLLQL